MKEKPPGPLFPDETSNGKEPADKPHYHGHRERLRQKFSTTSGAGLADYELLELLLTGFLPRRDVKPLAKSLIHEFKGLSGVFAASQKRLQSVDGVGETLAILLKSVHEIQLRVSKEEISEREILSSWSKVLEYVKLRLQHEQIEFFRVLFLDNKNRLIADEELGRGTIDHAPVYPREIARRALDHSAKSIILVHNHPSGDPTPSRADISMTRDIIDALEPIEVTVHDHLVVGKAGVTSMKATGLI